MRIWQFNPTYLNSCAKMKPTEILSYLEDYKKSLTPQSAAHPLTKEKSILISIKIPQSLLKEFKLTCEEAHTKYQTQIKILMKEWLDKN